MDQEGDKISTAFVILFARRNASHISREAQRKREEHRQRKEKITRVPLFPTMGPL